MGIFTLLFFEIETKSCVQSVFAAKAHIFLVQNKRIFLPLAIKIFLQTHSGHTSCPYSTLLQDCICSEQ